MKYLYLEQIILVCNRIERMQKHIQGLEDMLGSDVYRMDADSFEKRSAVVQDDITRLLSEIVSLRNDLPSFSCAQAFGLTAWYGLKEWFPWWNYLTKAEPIPPDYAGRDRYEFMLPFPEISLPIIPVEDPPSPWVPMTQYETAVVEVKPWGMKGDRTVFFLGPYQRLNLIHYWISKPFPFSWEQAYYDHLKR